MAFVKEDHVLPNWLPCIMTGLLFLDQQPSPRIDAVFLDWSKAFDKVSHSLLLCLTSQVWNMRSNA